MGNKWATTAVTGYATASVTDDGAATAANQVKYSTIKTDLANPIKSTLTQVITNLDELFTNTTRAKSGAYTTVTSDHTRVIECTSTFTLTLLAAATAGAGYYVTVKNAGTGLLTVARSGTDTIDGLTSLYLYPGEGATYVVNAAGTSYISTFRAAYPGTAFSVVSSANPIVTGFGGSSVYNNMESYGNASEQFDNGGIATNWKVTPGNAATQYWMLSINAVLTHATTFPANTLAQVVITRFNSVNVAQSRNVVCQDYDLATNSSWTGGGSVVLAIASATDYFCIETFLSSVTNYNVYHLNFFGSRVA